MLLYFSLISYCSLLAISEAESGIGRCQRLTDSIQSLKFLLKKKREKKVKLWQVTRLRPAIRDLFRKSSNIAFGIRQNLFQISRQNLFRKSAKIFFEISRQNAGRPASLTSLFSSRARARVTAEEDDAKVQLQDSKLSGGNVPGEHLSDSLRRGRAGHFGYFLTFSTIKHDFVHFLSS